MNVPSGARGRQAAAAGAGRRRGSQAERASLTPPELVQAHLNLDAQTMAAVARAVDKPIIVR